MGTTSHDEQLINIAFSDTLTVLKIIVLQVETMMLLVNCSSELLQL